MEVHLSQSPPRETETIKTKRDTELALTKDPEGLELLDEKITPVPCFRVSCESKIFPDLLNMPSRFLKGTRVIFFLFAMQFGRDYQCT